MNLPVRETLVAVFVLYGLQGLCTCDDVKCFRCFDAEDPKACSQTAVCGKNEICFTKQFEDHVGKQRYHLGCEDQTMCTLFKTATLIGRRDTTSRKCFDCCSSAECNSHLCNDTVQTQVHKLITTTAPTTTTTTTTTTALTTTTTSTTTKTTYASSCGSGYSSRHTRSGPLRDTGSIQWRDCSHGNPWMTVHHLDISPSPLKLPGDFKVTLDASISHHVANSLSVDVLWERKLLGRWTKVPCNMDIGTCNYDDFCTFLGLLKYLYYGLQFHQNPYSCPAQLTANGIPCTCPFNPMGLHLPSSTFTINSLSSTWKFLTTGEYHIKITMNEKSTKQERACAEAFLCITV